jgi:hypothetical protein
MSLRAQAEIPNNAPASTLTTTKHFTINRPSQLCFRLRVRLIFTSLKSAALKSAALHGTSHGWQ